jgi:hypothetical protein
MKVDTQPFPGVNMVESHDRTARRQLDFALGINMAGWHHVDRARMERLILAIGSKRKNRNMLQRGK